MLRPTIPIAGFLALAVSACSSTHSPAPPEAQHPAAHDAAHQAAHQAPHEEPPHAVQLVHYRAGEGFVPARVDVETGTRVVLVNDSDEPLAPRFGVGHGHSRSGHQADHHGTHGPDAEPSVPAWKSHGSHPDGDGQQWAHTFGASGYFRYHNDLDPSHAGLVVALPPPGETLPPLVLDRLDDSFDTPPALTDEQYRELLGDSDVVREYMKTYGPHTTLTILRQAETETGIDCHHSAHYLGRMTFAEYGAAASVSVEEICRSGMRHGVMEQLFVNRGITSLAEDIELLCPSEDSSYSRHQCLHGVGHGVMAWTAYEIEDALGLCDRLSGEPSQRSCYTGVFMENVVSGLSREVGQRSAYVDRDDPHYPCNSLAERYVDDCYWYQTSQMLRVFGRDLTLVAEACQEAPTAARRACFGSYGRDISGMHGKSPHRVVQYCQLAPTSLYRSDCIDGAARTLFWDESQQSEGLALCATVQDPLVAETCYESIIMQAHAVVPDPEEFCVRLPEGWRDRCREP